MKLRSQLLLAAALTLLLPLVAFRAVQQMDVALRDARKFEVSKSINSIGSLLRHSGVLPTDAENSSAENSRDLYAELIDHKIVLDGYGDDWANLKLRDRLFTFADHKSTKVHNGGGKLAQVRLRMAASEYHLHMLLAVKDQRVRFHKPPMPVVASEFSAAVDPPGTQAIATGDHVIIYLRNSAGEITETVIRAIAPGPVVGRRYGPSKEGVRPIHKVQRVRGYWASTQGGYQLELRLPLPRESDVLGFAVVDIDDHSANSGREAWVGSVDPAMPNEIGRLVYASRRVENLLQEVVPKGSRARVYDIQGRMRADVNRLYERPSNPALLNPARMNLFNALLYRFFEWVITKRENTRTARFAFINPLKIEPRELEKALQEAAITTQKNADLAPVRRYVSPERDQVMGALTPLQSNTKEQLFLLFESNEDTANAFTSSAMVRMFSLVTLIGLLVAITLFTYATWLSWRIRKLSRQAKSAVTGDGRFRQEIIGSSAKDEIGDMSRSISQLVERSAGYTQYLESLASKLSHELRTPLSVVQTSLENMEIKDIEPDDRLLLQRAQGGASQLGVLIRSMSEAARLEQTVQRSEFVSFNPANWLENACAAYQGVYVDYRFKTETNTQATASLIAVPELLQQALDKLISNAVDFADPDSTITVTGTDAGNFYEVSVINQGAAIDETQIDQLFEPMFSQRAAQSGEAHLGLGLYIVKLIAEAHDGVAYAQNLTAENSVKISFSVMKRKLSSL